MIRFSFQKKICAVAIKQIVRRNSDSKRLELLQLSRGWWLGLRNGREDRKSFCSLHGIIKIPSASHNDVGLFSAFHLDIRQWESKILETQVRNCSFVLAATAKGIGQILNPSDPLPLWICVYPGQFNHTCISSMLPMQDSSMYKTTVCFSTHICSVMFWFIQLEIEVEATDSHCLSSICPPTFSLRHRPTQHCFRFSEKVHTWWS